MNRLKLYLFARIYLQNLYRVYFYSKFYKTSPKNDCFLVNAIMADDFSEDDLLRNPDRIDASQLRDPNIVKQDKLLQIESKLPERLTRDEMKYLLENKSKVILFEEPIKKSKPEVIFYKLSNQNFYFYISIIRYFIFLNLFLLKFNN